MMAPVNTIRVLVVDDEPLAREGIRLHLADAPDMEVVGECGDGLAAVAAIEELRPELVFLDVQMPGLDGFAVLQALEGEQLPEVIFVTAYDAFALRAFDAQALDYLMKPIDPERFARSLDRARTRVRRRREGDVDRRLRALLDQLGSAPSHLDRIVVRTGARIVILRVEDVDYIESAANYVRIHAGGKEYLLRETMQALEAKLDPRRFARIHRSTIVRLDAIRALEPLFQGDYVLILENGTRLTSSRTYRDRLKDFLDS